MLKKLIEKYRFLPPVLASALVVLYGGALYGVGKGIDHLTREAYPLYVYPFFSDWTWGDIFIVVSVLTLFVGILSYNLARWIHEKKA